MSIVWATLLGGLAVLVGGTLVGRLVVGPLQVTPPPRPPAPARPPGLLVRLPDVDDVIDYQRFTDLGEDLGGAEGREPEFGHADPPTGRHALRPPSTPRVNPRLADVLFQPPEPEPERP